MMSVKWRLPGVSVVELLGLCGLVGPKILSAL